jgi:AraC-like DNA-binding protein
MENDMKPDGDRLTRLNKLIEKHTGDQQAILSPQKTFAAMRETTQYKRKPILYTPLIILVGQGRKACYVGNQTYEYGPGDLLVMLLPIPVEAEIIEASPEKPFIATGALVDFARISNVLLKIENADSATFQPMTMNPSSIFSTRANDKLVDAFIRLVETFDNPMDTAVLSESIIDEIYYRILVDERGGELRYLLQQRGEIQRISKAVEHIHQNLTQPVSVQELAGLVHMSRSAFFNNFKDVMHVSPLQYAKSVKLHRAQVLIQEGKKANEAGYQVGYNSPAQFSREYKRHFGYSPSAT